jgi:hypothetical protein
MPITRTPTCAAFYVSKNFGASPTRITEKHYAHLSPNYVADATPAATPA